MSTADTTTNTISKEYQAELTTIIKITTMAVNWCVDMRKAGVRVSDGLLVDGNEFVKQVANRKIAQHETEKCYERALDLLLRIIHWYEHMRNLKMPAHIENAVYSFVAMYVTFNTPY